MISQMKERIYKDWLGLLLLVSMACANNWPEYFGPRSVSISEAESIGAQLMNFTVDDLDGDPLTVTINFDRQFHLQETSHNDYRISLKARLDRETSSRYTIQISISDGTATSFQDVVVRVSDVNDYTPTISNLPLIATVMENRPIGTFVINITTDDDDMGYNAATEIFIDDPSLPFYLGDFSTRERVEHSYGQACVLLDASLDYESRSLYQVEVTVTDMAGCSGSHCEEPLTMTQILTVNVIDVQDTAPYFTAVRYSATAVENMPIGSPIIQVTALDGDASASRDIEYYFQNSAGEAVSVMDYFAIDLTTGEISNSEIIDTDSEVIQTHGLQYSLTVLAKEVLIEGDVENAALDSTTTTVRISLHDLNDQKPTFSHPEATAAIVEELPVGSPLRLSTNLRVSDPDQDINGTFTLRALNVDGGISPWFTVSPVRAVNDAVVSLSTAQRINFESSHNLTVKIEAKDQQSNQTSYTIIAVQVEDSNDNSPRFSLSTYEGVVKENSHVGELVNLTANLNVTDDDSGAFGDVTYSISGDSTEFAIDSNTGALTVACDLCLDRESKSDYYLNVIATDGGGLTDRAQLVIRVVDVNDHDPVFSEDIYHATLNESSTRFYSNLVVQASDADEGRNKDISYTLLNYTDNFHVLPNGSVYITSPLDAEENPAQIEITVVASDNGLPAKTSRAVLRLELVDLNDEEPRFTRTAPLVRVPENADLGTLVYTVLAVDDDRSAPNNQVTYNLLSGGFGQFSINSQTGDIIVSSLLNREGTRDQYSLVVSAADKGLPAHSTQQTIVIKVEDVNDEVPEFSQALYRFSVEEGSYPGEFVGSVQASDPDLSQLLTYNISSTIGYNLADDALTLSNEVFTMDASNGRISVNAALDRETVSKVVLTVTAEDLNGLIQQISTAQVEVAILDINDNAPVIEPVGTLEITENRDSAMLTRLTVSDDDSVGELEFSISNNPDGAFHINNEGELRLIKAVDREIVGNWMNLTVVVQDGMNNALSSSIDIAVYVKDVNDKAPQFTDFVAEVAVREDVPVGFNLSTVTAVDADFDLLNTLVQYRIRSGAQGKVDINRMGLLKVIGDLDRDRHQFPNNSLSLVIEACDSGIPPLCSTQDMTVRIIDVNDNTPTFTRPSYTARISETAQTDHILVVDGNVQIRATDPDAAPNGQNVKYSCCSPGNDTSNLFSVNTQGHIVVASPLGLRGHAGVYSLTVKATDWGTPNKTGSAVVIVRVSDYNDHTPVLSVYNDGSTTVHRPENSSRGAEILTVRVTDDDVGENSVVDLVFVTDVSELGDYSHFYIDASSNGGTHLFTIRQNITFDRETNSEPFRFGVVGKDRGLPQLTSEIMIITVYVDDVNDNEPYFSVDKQSVGVKVREEEVGVLITSVNFAKDDDDRKIFCYSIIGARNVEEDALPAPESAIRRLFTINSKTAEVRIAAGQKLDRESQQLYILVIQADDRDENVYNDCKKPLYTPWTHQRIRPNEMELHITVEDIDDNAPQFSQQFFTVAVVRDTPSPNNIINMQGFVMDPDENQSFVFSKGSDLVYSPASLGSAIKTSEPIKIYSNGDIKSEIAFTESMQGTISFDLVATDSIGHSTDAKIKILIIDSDSVVSLTVSRDLTEVKSSITEFKRIFQDHAGWNISVVEIKVNSAKSYHTDIHMFAIPDATLSPPKASQILQEVDDNTALLSALHRYGFVDIEPVTAGSTEEEPPPSNKRVIIIAVVVAVVLVAIVVLVLVLCYVMRSRYKRKLKAAHAMAFDTHTLGFEIDQSDVPQSVTNIPGSTKHSTPVILAEDKMSVTSLLYPHHADDAVHEPYCLTLSANKGWSKDSPLNNFDWGNSNTAFDRHKFYRQSRESHRSSHSHDDNAIDPLNGVETQSCSSAGSQDWRLDLRGNNLDNSPPPPVTDDVLQSVFNEHNNQLNYDSKFADSQSDHSSSTNKEDGHFNRLIMSDSVYGKIYETRRMPNGLETTEV